MDKTMTFPRDRIINFKGNLIQHGPLNDRVYLMRYSPVSPETLPSDLICFAQKKGYAKIFVKVPKHRSSSFVSVGFKQEALIPGFFRGKEQAVFMSHYLKANRESENNIHKINKTLALARVRKVLPILNTLANQPKVKKCIKDDVTAITRIYHRVFASYPFPIHDPEYILNTMDGHVQYFGVESEGKLVAVASAEIDGTSKTAELADFATLPEFRGNHFSRYLIHHMEKRLKKEKIKTTYTIARALSPGMNIAFSQSRYRYAGRLKNNTNISGNIESMNVWYKSFKDPS